MTKKVKRLKGFHLLGTIQTETMPWVQRAIDAGRPVPKWIAERSATEKEFEENMALREAAFPQTKK
jgi:hypothetical protein